MRKIGIAALTLLALATAACTESPVGIHAEDTRAALNGGFVGSGSYEEESAHDGFGDAGEPVEGDEGMTISEMERNPGVLGSGH